MNDGDMIKALLVAKLDEINALFKHEARVTLVVRVADQPDVVVGNDLGMDAIKAIAGSDYP